MNNLLHNIVWHSLAGPQAHLATGTDTARRYAPGFSPIVGFADPQRPDFDALLPYCEPDEHFYCDGWSGACPPGWTIEVESTMYKMVWEAGLPTTDDTLDARPLGPAHAQQALELATLTRPGPFGIRTIELGDYVGCFEGDRLIAMAGERMHAASLREISGVCTHPDFQGRALARRLMNLLLRRQLQRGQTPFLHVMHDNLGAHALYQRMGFVDFAESVVRVVARG